MRSSSATFDTNANPITIRSIVFDITESESTTGIRLIGLPDIVTDFRQLIMDNSGACAQPIAWERQEGDSHVFNLFSSWLDKSNDPRTWRLTTAVFKYMTEAGWALIKSSQLYHSSQFTLFFQFDPSLPKEPINPRDLAVIHFQTWAGGKITVKSRFDNHIQQCVRDAIKTYRMKEIGHSTVSEVMTLISNGNEGVSKDGSIEFRLPKNLHGGNVQNIIDSRVMQSSILANLQLQGFKLAASFDIGLRPSSDTWVLRRIEPAEESDPPSPVNGEEEIPPLYDYGKLKDDSKDSTTCKKYTLYNRGR